MEDVEREMNLQLDVAGHEEEIVRVMASVTGLVPAPWEKSQVAAAGTCCSLCSVLLLIVQRFLPSALQLSGEGCAVGQSPGAEHRGAQARAGTQEGTQVTVVTCAASAAAALQLQRG